MARHGGGGGVKIAFLVPFVGLGDVRIGLPGQLKVLLTVSSVDSDSCNLSTAILNPERHGEILGKQLQGERHVDDKRSNKRMEPVLSSPFVVLRFVVNREFGKRFGIPYDGFLSHLARLHSWRWRRVGNNGHFCTLLRLPSELCRHSPE